MRDVVPNRKNYSFSLQYLSRKYRVEFCFCPACIMDKFGLNTNIHFLVSFSPFSIFILRLSPTFKEYSSYQTEQSSFCKPNAMGAATLVLSRLSWQMNASGFSF